MDSDCSVVVDDLAMGVCCKQHKELHDLSSIFIKLTPSVWVNVSCGDDSRDPSGDPISVTFDDSHRHKRSGCELDRPKLFFLVHLVRCGVDS